MGEGSPWEADDTGGTSLRSYLVLALQDLGPLPCTGEVKYTVEHWILCLCKVLVLSWALVISSVWEQKHTVGKRPHQDGPQWKRLTASHGQF